MAFEARREHGHEHGREHHAEQRDGARDGEQQSEHGARDPAGFLRAALAEQLRVNGNERRAQRALPEQILQHVGQPQPGTEHVGLKTRAEIRRDDALANEAHDAADEDAAGHEHRSSARGGWARTVGGRRLARHAAGRPSLVRGAPGQ